MKPDHLYIFTNSPDEDALALLEAGFSEGPSRIHVGQGTQNRKFYWSNFFLELLWVYDSQEVQTPGVAPTLLWERSNWLVSGYSRVGLCLENQAETDQLFQSAWQYQPAYFPKGTTIDMLNDTETPAFPALFRLPFPSDSARQCAHTEHNNGTRMLTHLHLEYHSEFRSRYNGHFPEQSAVHIEKSNRNWVHLTFDNVKQQRACHFPNLELSIQF